MVHKYQIIVESFRQTSNYIYMHKLYYRSTLEGYVHRMVCIYII